MKQLYWLASIVCCLLAASPAWAAPAQSNPSTSPAKPSPIIEAKPTEPSVKRSGSPRIYSPDVTLTAIEQRVNVSGSEIDSPRYEGNSTAAGTIFGGTWLIRVKQPDLQNQQSWNLAEARIQQLTNQADYIFGSQPPFWPSIGTGDLWGFTTILRQGFQPLTQLNGNSDPRQRLQADQIKRTISGRAEPGTFVRLTEDSSERAITEVLVDASGIYRFDHVLSGNYRVLLYPQGQLAAQPKIRNVTLTTMAGQLPTGASALIFSGGFRRNLPQNQNFLGDFSDFRGGIAQRWGLSEDLTMGLGGVYDETFRGLGEVFFQPKNFPLQVAVWALTGNTWDINTDISFAPSPNFNASFKSDRLFWRFNLNWKIFPDCTLLGTYHSRDGAAIEAQIAFSGKIASTFARVTLDTQNRFRWELRQRLGSLEFSQQGNEIKTLSGLTYKFSNTNSLVLNYEINQKESNSLATLAWRYSSPQQAIDRNYIWEVELGFGISSQGSGLIASLKTTLIPGLLLQARYQQVSVTSDRDKFSLELVPSLHL